MTRQFKKCLQFEQCVVEKLPSFVKLLAIFFQKSYKSVFLVRFVVSYKLTHLPMESFLCCMLVVEMPGM